jgi:hypothetical protein
VGAEFACGRTDFVQSHGATFAGLTWCGRFAESLRRHVASTEAVLYAKKLDEDARRKARFECELLHEVMCWERVQQLIEDRLSARKALSDQAVAKRKAEEDL